MTGQEGGVRVMTGRRRVPLRVGLGGVVLLYL